MCDILAYFSGKLVTHYIELTANCAPNGFVRITESPMTALFGMRNSFFETAAIPTPPMIGLGLNIV